jgi:hypothetical protein
MCHATLQQTCPLVQETFDMCDDRASGLGRQDALVKRCGLGEILVPVGPNRRRMPIFVDTFARRRGRMESRKLPPDPAN